MEPRGPIVTKDGPFAANAWTMVRVRRGTQAAVHERGLTVQRALEQWLGGAPQIVGQNAQPAIATMDEEHHMPEEELARAAVPARHHPAAEVAHDAAEEAGFAARRARIPQKAQTKKQRRAEAAAYIPGDE